MDHLPYPREAFMPTSLEVPFLLGDIYHSAKNASDVVPVSEHLAAASADKEYWAVLSIDDLPSFAQRVVYFGLLADVLKDKLNITEFMRCSQDADEPVLTLRTLEGAIQAAARSGVSIEAGRLIELALRARAFAEPIRFASPDSNKIFLSIDVLVWTLIAILHPARCLGGRLPYGPVRDDDIVVELLRKAGWCEHWIAVYCNKYLFSVPLLLYLSGMPEATHSGHESCGPEECIAHNIGKSYEPSHARKECRCEYCLSDEEEEKLKDKVESKLSRGQLPLLRLREGNSTTNNDRVGGTKGSQSETDIKLDVMEAQFGRPFIAISHVWSGGLGNRNDNVIRKCQLKLIQSGAKQCRQMAYGEGMWAMSQNADADWKQSKFYRGLSRLLPDDEAASQQEQLEWYLDWIDRAVLYGANEEPDDLYIWFDTVCVPIAKKAKPVGGNSAAVAKGDESVEDAAATKSNERAASLKTEALRRMAFVYAAAMQVLVIDPDIRRMSYKDTEDDVYVAAMLMTSPWMTRAWTFQEGCLGRQVSFMLEDRLLQPRIWQSRNDPPDRCRNNMERIVKAECLRVIQAMPDVMNGSVQAEKRLERFIMVWNQLSIRSTTESEDAHRLLAVMLDLSAHEVLEIRDAEGNADRARRMLAILKSQETLPLSMLLLPYPSGDELISDFEWVPIFPTGQLVEWPGVLRWDVNGSALAFCAGETQSAFFILPHRGIGGNFKCHSFLIANAEGIQTQVQVTLLHPIDQVLARRTSTKYKRVGLFLHAFTNRDFPVTFRAAGACFSITAEDDEQVPGQMSVEFLCPVEYERSSHEAISRAQEVISRVKLTALPAETVFTLSCDPSMWPKTDYRRVASPTLQKSPSLPASIIVLVLWSLYISLQMRRAPSEVATSMSSSLEHGFGYLPAWLRYINIPLRLFRLAFRSPKIALTMLTVGTRMFAFAMIDYPRLQAVVRRIRYQRHAESFDYAHKSTLASRLRDRRFGKEALYQYFPLWRLGIPVLLAASNFVAARSPSIRPYLLYLPWSPKIHPSFLDIVGKAMLFETALRTGWEVVWRLLRWDTSSAA